MLLGVFDLEGVTGGARGCGFVRTVDVLDVVDCPVCCAFNGLATGGDFTVLDGGDLTADVFAGEAGVRAIGVL